MGHKPYTTNVQEYNSTTRLAVTEEDKWNGWTIVNRGSTMLIVNGEPIPPNEAKQTGGNEGEIFLGAINISFDSTGATPPLINAAWLTSKFYIGERSFDKIGK